MIDTQAIRSKILDLAMRGKLTEQLPEDGTAEELYRQIQAEKQKLIKSGKIKKEKPLSEISNDEVPFPIPNSWKWERLGALLRVISGISYEKSDVSTSGLRILRGGNIQNTGIILDHSDVFLPPAYKDDDKIVRKGDVIVVASTGSETAIGRAGYAEKDYESTMIGAFLRICRPIEPSISMYIRAIFMSDYYLHHIRHESKGTNINNVKEKYITHFVVPMPPLAEQHRIVARIDQAFSLLDTIDTLQSKYADNLAVLKSKLIDAAIRGKLTDQLPEDGTAEELYRQIQAEKQALIKAGKIKKEKPLPEIIADEIPFEIPKSWKWVRTGDVFSVGTGLTPLTNEKRFYENGRIPWVTSSLTSNRYIQDTTTYLSEYALEATSLRLHPKHTLVIAMYGEGKTRGQIAELLISATTNQACATLDNIVYNQATVDYVYFFFTHNYAQLRSQAGGSNQPNLNLNKIKETLIPLPPLAEQKRIVDRINELLAVCDELKSKGNP